LERIAAFTSERQPKSVIGQDADEFRRRVGRIAASGKCQKGSRMSSRRGVKLSPLARSVVDRFPRSCRRPSSPVAAVPEGECDSADKQQHAPTWLPGRSRGLIAVAPVAPLQDPRLRFDPTSNPQASVSPARAIAAMTPVAGQRFGQFCRGLKAFRRVLGVQFGNHCAECLRNVRIDVADGTGSSSQSV